MGLGFSTQDEVIVLQNLEAFKAGGSDIEYRGHKNPTKLLYLRSHTLNKYTNIMNQNVKKYGHEVINNASHRQH